MKEDIYFWHWEVEAGELSENSKLWVSERMRNRVGIVFGDIVEE